MPARALDSLKSHLDHEKHLDDFHALKELPESYEWAPLDQDQYPSIDQAPRVESVPLIDLDGPNVENLVGNACKEWRVFQVINHGIATRKLDNIESACRRLFSLPQSQKVRAARSLDGVTGYGPARISSFFQKQMWSEGFTILGSPLEHARLLWPDDYTEFCEITEEYQEEMKRLAGKIMWLMLGSLGITQEDLEWAGPARDFQDACAALQLNSYPKCPDPDRAMGLAAHTDSTLLTILYQNTTKGLQVLQEGFGWVTVQPVPGALIVNVGDLFHILSNGSYPSVVHRAMVNQTRHRFSVAYLYGPPRDALVSPHRKMVDHNRPPMYRAVSWKEYLGIKAIHFDKALSTIKICTPSAAVSANDYSENDRVES
ncbi:Gibberellin 3-beta-dioxygenase 1-like protein [Drosera capensis]